MPSTLNHETLKALRDQKNLTQEDLAKKCKCTTETVGRWERGESKVRRPSLKDALCNALEVTWDVLCGPCQSGNVTKAPRATDDGRAEILRNLNARISDQAQMAFTLASQRYGVRIADIVELAPLLFMVAAEQSLADRAQNLRAFEDTLGEVGDWQHKLSQFSGVIKVPYEIEEALLGEYRAIERRDLYGSGHWRSDDWNSPDNDPWVRYLRTIVEGANLTPALVERIGSRVSRHGLEPFYHLGIDALKAITGLTGETAQEQDVLDHVSLGFLDFRDVVAKKKSLSVCDFQAWLAEATVLSF